VPATFKALQQRAELEDWGRMRYEVVNAAMTDAIPPEKTLKFLGLHLRGTNKAASTRMGRSPAITHMCRLHLSMNFAVAASSPINASSY
jgi:hypothetical protein